MSADYTHDGQQRILALLKTLAGNEINGMAPSDIARAQACSASCVTRDLDNLRTAGFAEQVPESGLWRLSPELVQIAVRFQVGLSRAANRIAETESRFTRQ